MTPPLPTFLILGAPKCGTTSLAYYLGQHPDVVLSDPKEPHFFDGNYQAGLSAYRQHFRHHGGEQAIGEATPSYLTVPWVAERIASDLPQARLIAILRDPVERAWSHWWMLHSRGLEPLSFQEALEASPREIDGLSEERWSDHLRQRQRGLGLGYRNYLVHGYYADHLERYLALFPSDQLRVVRSADLHADPEKLIKGLWTFLGVSGEIPLSDARRQNEALGRGSRGVMMVLRASGLSRLGPLLPDRVKARVKSSLARLGRRPVMPSGTERWLRDHYAPYELRLEALLERTGMAAS